MTFCRAVSARTGMVTMAVRQAAAKPKPIEVLRIMTITCDEGPERNVREGVPFRAASHKNQREESGGNDKIRTRSAKTGGTKSQIYVARRSRWKNVLPHREMFPTRQALPHQACSRCLIGLRPGHSSSSIS